MLTVVSCFVPYAYKGLLLNFGEFPSPPVIITAKFEIPHFYVYLNTYTNVRIVYDKSYRG